MIHDFFLWIYVHIKAFIHWLQPDVISLWFQQFAYEPMTVYITSSAVLLACAFGLPLPEEIILVAVGVLAYIGAHPEFYPPPIGADVVDPYIAAAVCFVAVLGGDYIIFLIGKYGGDRIKNTKIFSRFVPPHLMEKIEGWYQKYGVWTCAGLRFAPGLRSPGFFISGMLKLPTWKFFLGDGLAALISVPTQIILVAHIGKVIVRYIHKFRDILIVAGLIALILYFGLKTYRWIQKRKAIKLGKTLE